MFELGRLKRHPESHSLADRPQDSFLRRGTAVEEGDLLGAHLHFPGDGEVAASQKSPADKCSKEFAGSEGRTAEVLVGRSTSLLVGPGTGERLQDVDWQTESSWEGNAEDVIVPTSRPLPGSMLAVLD